MTTVAGLLAEIELYDSLLTAMIAESKHFTTHGHVAHAPSSRNRTRTQLHTWDALANYGQWKNAKKYQAGLAKAALDRTKANLRYALMTLTHGYKAGRYKENQLKELARIAFDTAYTEAYGLGLQASGITRLDKQRKTATSGPAFDPHDKEWLKTALAHERRYWNEFVDSIITGTIDAEWRRFTMAQRVEMYVRTLDHVYETARVVGHPTHSIIYWVLNPAEHCEGCVFLAEKSPYTRETLPAVPRAGSTPCLANCKCELRIVTHANVAQWEKVKAQNNRNLLVAKLKSLKRRG
jgi:hypothetical protein